MDPHADAQPRELLPERRVLDVGCRVARVEAADAQEGVAADGGGGRVEERHVAGRAADRSSASRGSCTGWRGSWCRIVGALHAAERRRRPSATKPSARAGQRVGPHHDVGVDEEEILAPRRLGALSCVPRPARPGPSSGTMRTGKRSAISRERSVEPSSTTMTSKSLVARLEEARQALLERGLGVVDRHHDRDARTPAPTRFAHRRASHRASDGRRRAHGASPARCDHQSVASVHPSVAVAGAAASLVFTVALEALRQAPARAPARAAARSFVLAGILRQVEEHPLAARRGDELVGTVVRPRAWRGCRRRRSPRPGRG